MARALPFTKKAGRGRPFFVVRYPVRTNGFRYALIAAAAIAAVAAVVATVSMRSPRVAA